MKWNKKGHELDQRAERIIADFASKKGIAIFGAGLRGAELRRILGHYGIFDGFIDNDPKKQENGFEGEEVNSLEKYDQKKGSSWIAIAASEDSSPTIAAQLKKAGYCEGVDYFYYEEFLKDIFPVLSFYYFRKLFVYLAQICVTERCTLHCKKCAHACNKVNIMAQDMTLEKAKESADFFFQYVDLVNEFVLLGGEPLLYEGLEELVSYIGEKYREKILMFSITTNGTILLSDKMIDLCKRYRVTLRVSDYAETLPWLQSRYELLYKQTSQMDVIVWKTKKKDCWFDYGYGEFSRREGPGLLEEVFDRCRTDCREIRGSRYYYCVMARSVAENMRWPIGDEDYLELKGLGDNKLFFEYQQGYSEKGYMDLCRYCRGAEAVQFLIPAAEQEN